eukprot:CAMPEP_0113847522 /NCGR_PEP_ID=MMETSP0372-20130328/1922_1 /TAXON_ID=340204 /ORGANISM="Lankesteria abbotti" /LENGTH=244 /DNA_ID=CAMNT_0000816811 /DNA_START=242 /DNA_END=976 /DNA_ORIENTATION=+ /assembly_acc=CAM_ASM_000359
MAAAVNRQLADTEAKLQELNKLARQRQIFNDKTSFVQELTFEIKQSLTDLNREIEVLSQDVERSAQQSARTRNDFQVHNRNLTETLKGRLLDLTQKFKDALELRTKNMRQQDMRRNLYTSTEDTGNTLATSSRVAFDLESGQQSQAFAERGHLYYQSRAEAMENVQRVIGELGQIFGKVASMVSHHEEMIQRIDADVDDSLHHIKEGESQLLRFYKNVSSSRTLILKVFGIVVFFILFFVLFLA